MAIFTQGMVDAAPSARCGASTTERCGYRSTCTTDCLIRAEARPPRRPSLFVTLHKSADLEAGTAHADALGIDRSSMRWFTTSNRNLKSRDLQPIVKGSVVLHVFAKKDDAHGREHYYLGRATAHDAVETTMPKGERLPVVRLTLRFEETIKQGLCYLPRRNDGLITQPKHRFDHERAQGALRFG